MATCADSRGEQRRGPDGVQRRREFLALRQNGADIGGTITAGTGKILTITDDAPSFGPQGALVAGGGSVVLAPFTAGAGFTLGGGGGLSGTSAITANTLVIGSASAGTVTVAGAFNLSGVPALSLISGGASSRPVLVPSRSARCRRPARP